MLPEKFLNLEESDKSPIDFFSSRGKIGPVWDLNTQDSGNVSFGLKTSQSRYFVKTAGALSDKAFLSHEERVALLDNAYLLATEIEHQLLVDCHGKIGSIWGTVLVYEWIDGELINGGREQRSNPDSAYNRLKELPFSSKLGFFNELIGLHHVLIRKGWVACDLYDGCIIRDFKSGSTKLVDLDMYRKGDFENKMGRMFGSTRFMAPEEFKRGEVIDEKTTQFTIVRICQHFFGNESNSKLEKLKSVLQRSTSECKSERYNTFLDFKISWEQAAILCSKETRTIRNQN